MDDDTNMNIVILGSTGSIGSSTLKVIAENSGKFSLNLLTANSNDERLLDQCKNFCPKYAYMADQAASKRLRQRIIKENLTTEVLIEEKDLHEIIANDDTEIVVAAMPIFIIFLWTMTGTGM